MVAELDGPFFAGDVPFAGYVSRIQAGIGAHRNPHVVLPCGSNELPRRHIVDVESRVKTPRSVENHSITARRASPLREGFRSRVRTWPTLHHGLELLQRRRTLLSTEKPRAILVSAQKIERHYGRVPFRAPVGELASDAIHLRGRVPRVSLERGRLARSVFCDGC